VAALRPGELRGGCQTTAQLMILLELEHVGKRYRNGARVTLEDVSVAIKAGEMVTIWGERRSGRSTLLRVAAGIERPDLGVVRFEGRDLADRESRAVGSEIGYCRKVFRSSSGHNILDHLLSAQFARRVPRSVAVRRSWEVLQRVDAEHCAKLTAVELSPDETVRVGIARALTSEPRLLVIDEPTIGVDLADRDRILALLRSLVPDGLTVLASTGEGTGLLGSDRVLSLSKGTLRGELIPGLAPVTDLSQHRRMSG
jgi:ABC-type ATPase involved in cell division